MSQEVTIIIPSSGRPRLPRCWHQLADDLRERTFVAVPESQYEDYMNWDALAGYANLLPVPDAVRGIAATRQHITQLVAASDDFLLQISDDVVFFRRIPGTVKLTQADADSVSDMVSHLTYHTALHGHAGVSARAGNNRVEFSVKTTGRMCDVYMHDPKLLMNLGIRWDRTPVMEDFDVTLQLLAHGYPNPILYEWCWDQPSSNLEGGCSAYRTPELQEAGAKRLQALHPDFVTAKVKKANNWKGFGGQRWDVTVQWQKAYIAGQDKVDLGDKAQMVAALYSPKET